MVNMTEVCEKNRGLIYSIAKRYYTACGQDRAVDLEDLAQAGYVGLIEAAQTYDDTKGMFSTWATLYIRLEMRKVLGLQQRDPRAERDALSLDAEIGEDLTIADTLEAQDDTEGNAGSFRAGPGGPGQRGGIARGRRTNDPVARSAGAAHLSEAGRLCGLSPSAANGACKKARETLYRNTNLRAGGGAYLDQRTHWYRQAAFGNNEAPG